MSISATAVWHENLRLLYTGGNEVSPRGMLTRELTRFQSSLDMNMPIVEAPARSLGYKFMAAEAAWILSGDNRVSSIAPYSSHIAKFSDDGVTFFGAYGPRIVDQMAYVVKTLAKDPDTRQACMEIWRPNPMETKDVPCTCFLQWLIRGKKLYCIDTMRSSDIWLGWPYDVFNFTMVSVAILLRLRNSYSIELELGDLTIQAGSQHLYEKNWSGTEEVLHDFNLIERKVSELPQLDWTRFKDEDDLRSRLWNMAHLGNGVLEAEAWFE